MCQLENHCEKSAIGYNGALRQGGSVSLRYLCGVICLLSACSSQEQAEVEPDYDNMVMLDEEEGPEWVSGEDKDRKLIAQDMPDPAELVIIEPYVEDRPDPECAP